MHLDLIQTLSLCGDATTPNDDRGGATAGHARVIDGATDLGPPGLLGDQGGAAWLAAAADAAFGTSLAETVRGTCEAVFADVERRFAQERRRAPAAAWELPSAAFAAAQLAGDRIEAAWAADCAILHRRGETVQWVTPMPDRASESADAAALGDGIGAQKLRSPAVLEDRRRARMRPGRRVLGVDAAAASAAVHYGGTAVAPGDELLLMSDGFSALIDAYGAYDANGFFAAVESHGLATLAVELRTIERDDAACRRFPRFKASDDATALWLRVAGYRSNAPTGEKLDQAHHQRDDQQDVDQAAGDMEAEAEQPQDQQDRNNCPQHRGISPLELQEKRCAHEPSSAPRQCFDTMHVRGYRRLAPGHWPGGSSYPDARSD